MAPGNGRNLRTGSARVAALAILWLLMASQGPDVVFDRVLADPADRWLRVVGAEAERVTVLAAVAVPEDEHVPMAALKRDAEQVARRAAGALAVGEWRLGNRVDDPLRVVFLDGRAGAGAQVRAVAWYDGERRGTALVVVQPGTLPDVAAVRRTAARAVAGALGMPPSAAATAAEVRGFLALAPEDVLALLTQRSGRLANEPVPLAVAPAGRGTRVIIGGLADVPVTQTILGEVVW